MENSKYKPTIQSAGNMYSVKSINLCKSVIQTIAKSHNGSLEVDTTKGVGTEFIIQLPIV